MGVPDGLGQGVSPWDSEWINRLAGATITEYPDLIKEAKETLPLWPDLSIQRRNEIVAEQASRMLWPGGSNKWAIEAGEGLPWGSPRILGHRGAGKTHSS